MVRVVLRDHRILQYNDAEEIHVESGTIALRHGRGHYLLAKIPLDIVERAEFDPPCKITKEKRVR